MGVELSLFCSVRAERGGIAKPAILARDGVYGMAGGP
jgi:hypothetical protein